MKTILFIVTPLIFYSFTVHAQLKHYFSYNTVFYADLMNPEKDKVSLTQSLSSLCLSYKIEKKKLGAEIYYSDIPRLYHRIRFPHIQPGKISQVWLTTLGVAIHYNVLNNKRIKLNPMAGLTYQQYESAVFELWRRYEPFHEPLVRLENEKKIGIVAGANINVPIYKGIYTNANIRYTVMPTADFNKQNLITEIGLGYMLQRKGDKKQSK